MELLGQGVFDMEAIELQKGKGNYVPSSLYDALCDKCSPSYLLLLTDECIFSFFVYRYILGAFLLVTDRVEHVRRLKNRGSDLRAKGDMKGAVKHFEWALDLNPKCVTCEIFSSFIIFVSFL